SRFGHDAHVLERRRGQDAVQPGIQLLGLLSGADHLLDGRGYFGEALTHLTEQRVLQGSDALLLPNFSSSFLSSFLLECFGDRSPPPIALCPAPSKRPPPPRCLETHIPRSGCGVGGGAAEGGPPGPAAAFRRVEALAPPPGGQLRGVRGARQYLDLPAELLG